MKSSCRSSFKWLYTPSENTRDKYETTESIARKVRGKHRKSVSAYQLEILAIYDDDTKLAIRNARENAEFF